MFAGPAQLSVCTRGQPGDEAKYLLHATMATDQDGGQLVVVKEFGLVDSRQLLAEGDTTFPHLALVKQLDGVMVETFLPFMSCLARIATNSSLDFLA